MERQKRFTFEFVFILFFAFYSILPSMFYGLSFIIPISVAVVYAFFIINKKRSITLKQIITFAVLIMFIALLYTLLVETHSISASASNRTLKQFASKLYQFTMIFIPLLFLDWAENRASKIEKRLTIYISFSLFFFVIAKTISELASNPQIVRSWVSFRETSSENIANYSFVYAIPFLAVLFVYLMRSVKNNYLKALIFALVIYQIYFLLLSQYTLAVIILSLGIINMLYIKIKRKEIKIIVAVFIPVFLLLLPFIIKFVAERVPSDSISIRLNEIYNFIMGSDEMGYNLSGRITIYKQAIASFLQSPIWGNSELGFDGHATFLTLPADLGLLGAVPFFYLLSRAKKRVCIVLGDDKGRFNPYWLMLLIMGFTNPIHSSPAIMYMIWFIVPLTMIEYKDNESEKEYA